MKMLTPARVIAIESEIKMLLHASRDCYRNQGRDATKFQFDVNDGYYAEIYGMLRMLKILNYGNFGAVNIPQERTNLSWWFSELQDEVLKEENFGGNGECDYCLERHGKDDAGRRREDLI